MTTYTESLIKLWLTVVLTNENLQDLSVKIVGNSGKGEGYIGDIIFVAVSGIGTQGASKKYNLVLKCSKSSAALMQNTPGIANAFIIECHMYEKVFPLFRKFQIDRGVNDPFDSLPKFYGIYREELKLVITLENLKAAGYDLWPMKNPQTRKHLDLVIGEYTKFHAVSIAMKEQKPEDFQKVVDGLVSDVFREILDSSNFLSVFQNAVEEAYNLFQNDLSNDILEKWIAFKDQIPYICSNLTPEGNELTVIIHGDCWNNNFMFKYEDEQRSIVSKVAILDWQISKISSPIQDLSYYLFASISEEDVADLETILKNYYSALCQRLAKLGTNLQNHSWEQFYEEWKKFAKFGLIFCILPMKAGFADQGDAPDMAESAEKGEDVSSGFEFKLKDASEYKNRLRPIIKYAAKVGII